VRVTIKLDIKQSKKFYLVDLFRYNYKLGFPVRRGGGGGGGGGWGVIDAIEEQE
jgi:hypothetical protein